MAETYRAVMLTAKGGTEVLKVVELPVETPAPGLLRVRVRAAGVGSTDLVMLTGGYMFAPKIPFVPGYEVAGRVRAHELRYLADSCGFLYLGDALPRGVPLRGSQLDSITAVWNVIDGEPRGTRIVAFDCRFGVGKGSWRRTVIAIKTDIGNITASSFNSAFPAFQIEQRDEWVFIYQPKHLALILRQLLSVSALRVYLETI